MPEPQDEDVAAQKAAYEQERINRQKAKDDNTYVIGSDKLGPIKLRKKKNKRSNSSSSSSSSSSDSGDDKNDEGNI